MRPGQLRFTAACQQLLVLAVVAAVLAPAASVLELDLAAPGAAPGGPGRADGGGAGVAAAPVARVETEPVTPEVTEQPLTPAAGSAARGTARRAPAALPRVRTTPSGAERVVGDPEPAEGFRTVGVTWDGQERVAEDDLIVEVRSRDEDGWSGWQELAYDEEHGPDAGTAEARRARPGTEPIVLGDVAEVQVRATGDVPAGLTLSVVDPGASGRTVTAAPAIDTAGPRAGRVESGDGVAPSPGAAGASEADGGEAAVLSAGTFTPEPRIFSRAQWGADERLRRGGSPSYHEVHAAFAHHTVNGNSYTRSQVPGILRSIYAYHTRSRGWSDVGYNFLVDKFGRIWEGRYGGVDRPVVGAHTSGYNHEAFAMSAIGNFETTAPSQAMLRAYGRLFAWKLSLHGIDATDPSVLVAGRRFRAINGHRDAGSTACPGRYLYARLPAVRSMAAAAQRDFSGRERETDLVDTEHPDVVLRRRSDKQVHLLPTGGLTDLARRRVGATGWSGLEPVASPDLDGDGHGDVVAVGDRRAALWSGAGDGSFTRTRGLRALAGRDLVAAAGDLDGDGDHDLVGRGSDGAAYAFLGTGSGGFRARPLGVSWAGLRLVTGTGDLTGDDRADIVTRDGSGRLRLWRGDGSGGFAGVTTVAGGWARFTDITGLGDWNRDGHRDLFARGPGGAGWVYPGRGDGTFTRRFGPVWGVKPLASLSGADVTGDAAPDLLGVSGDQLVVARNTGRFDAAAPRPTGLFVPKVNALLNVGDWDRDGDGDLLTRQAATGRLRWHPGNGEGGFDRARVIGSGFGGVRLLASVGDMTGDGFPDLMGQPKDGSMRIYPGRGADGLAPSYVAHRPVPGWRHVGFGRWDADGSPDSLVRVEDRLLLYPGNGPGGLETPRRVDLDPGPYDWFIGMGDVEGGEHPDVAVRQRETGELWLLRSRDGGFAKRRFLAEGLDAFDLYGN